MLRYSRASGSKMSYMNNENIRLSYKPQNILIYADKGRIAQVIRNVLNNAVKFIKKDGTARTITIEIEKRVRRIGENKEDDVVVVSIKDEGQGIDPEIM